jgi:hypothetical protein
MSDEQLEMSNEDKNKNEGCGKIRNEDLGIKPIK